MKKGRQCSYVETVAGKWMNGKYSLGVKYRGRIGQVQEDLYSWWRRKIAYSISKIDDFVKHVFREHNREADFLANMGAKGQRKNVIDICRNPESWNAVKGFWDGSFKDNSEKRVWRSHAPVVGYLGYFGKPTLFGHHRKLGEYEHVTTQHTVHEPRRKRSLTSHEETVKLCGGDHLIPWALQSTTLQQDHKHQRTLQFRVNV